MAWASGWPALSPGLAGSARARAARSASRCSRACSRPCCFSTHSVPMKWATPSLSQARRGELAIQAWVRAWTRTPFSCVGRWPGAERRGQQRAGLEGRVVGVGQVEEGELGAGLLAEPALQKRRDRRGGRGPEFDGRHRPRGGSRR